MSTCYAKIGTKAEFVEAAKALGWFETKADNGAFALSDGTNFCHDIDEWSAKGETLVGFVRYGTNDLSELAEELGFVSEHNDDYWELIE